MSTVNTMVMSLGALQGFLGNYETDWYSKIEVNNESGYQMLKSLRVNYTIKSI